MTVAERSRLVPAIVPFVGELGITYAHMDAAGRRRASSSHPPLPKHLRRAGGPPDAAASAVRLRGKSCTS